MCELSAKLVHCRFINGVQGREPNRGTMWVGDSIK